MDSNNNLIRRMCMFYNIIDLVQMKHIILSDDNPSIVTQSKNGQDRKPQDEQGYDHRQYRYLVTIFAENINQMIKMSKDCLGDLQFQPKYRISNEIQQMCQPNLSNIYLRYKEKISKETKYRNTLIKKTCSQYLISYQQVNPTPTIIKVDKTHLSSLSFIKKMAYIDKKTPFKSIKSQTRKTTSADSSQDKSHLICHTFQAFQTEFPIDPKFKTITSDNSARQYFFKSRSVLSRNDRGRIKSDSFASKARVSTTDKWSRNENNGKDRMVSQNQTLIKDNRRSYNNSNEEWQCDKQAKVHNKFCSKRVVAIGQSQKKAIQDIELLHLQTNNVCISKAFQTLPDNSYSYKPKGRSRLLKDYN